MIRKAIVSSRWLNLCQRYQFANQIKPAAQEATTVVKSQPAPQQNQTQEKILRLAKIEYEVAQSRFLNWNVSKLAAGQTQTRRQRQLQAVGSGFKYTLGLLGGTVALVAQLALGTFSIVTMGVTAGVAAYCGIKSHSFAAQARHFNLITKIKQVEDGYVIQYFTGSKPTTLKVKNGEPQGNISCERLAQLQNSEENGSRFGTYFNVNGKVLYLPSGLLIKRTFDTQKIEATKVERLK